MGVVRRAGLGGLTRCRDQELLILVSAGGVFAREVIGRGTIFRASRLVEHDIKGANKDEDEEGEVEEKTRKTIDQNSGVFISISIVVGQCGPSRDQKILDALCTDSTNQSDNPDSNAKDTLQ